MNGKTPFPLAVLFLLIAVLTSVVFWADVPSAVKIAFFAFGYGAGVATGARLTRLQQ